VILGGIQGLHGILVIHISKVLKLRHKRCYLKHYPKWKHYDLSIDKQRELILNCEVLGCEEEYVEEVIPRIEV